MRIAGCIIHMWRWGSLVLIILASTFGQSVADKYVDDLAGERVALSSSIASLRAGLARSGDPALQALQRQVDFSISEDSIPNAWVVRDPASGRSTVFMTAEFSLLVTYLADTDVVSGTKPEFSKCNLAYGRAVFDALAANNVRAASGKAPFRVLAPEIYLSNAANDCRKYQSLFPIDPALRARRDANVRAIYLLMYLHELGHVARGHQGVSMDSVKNLPNDEKRLNEVLRLLARSRAQETEADDWATDRLIDLLPNPSESLNSLLPSFYVAFGGFNCIYAEGSTHPTGFIRFNRHVGRIKDRAVAAGQLRKDSELAGLIEEARSLAARMQQGLACK